MGCGGSFVQRQPDVLVHGTGVEPLHCYIENTEGIVTLYPLGEMTSVDGVPVSAPVRLTQGTQTTMAKPPRSVMQVGPVTEDNIVNEFC